MKVRDLLKQLQQCTEKELEQEVQVHDQIEGTWHSEIVVEPDHDGVCEISIRH